MEDYVLFRWVLPLQYIIQRFRSLSIYGHFSYSESMRVYTYLYESHVALFTSRTNSHLEDIVIGKHIKL